MKKIIVLLLVASILAMATSASAGNKAGTFSISPVAGGVSFEGNQHLESSPVFGVRTGYNFTRVLGIEALFDYSRTKSTTSSKTLDFYRYGADALFHLWPDDKFVPYLAAGYAAMNLKGNNPYPGTAKTKGAFDYGLGFKYFVTEDIAWRADLRGLMYYYGKEDQHAVEYTTGVYIPFGGAPAVSRLADPPPPPTPVARQVMAPLPPPAPLASLRASPVSIRKGQTTKLSWTSRNVTECEILPIVGSVQTQGSLDVKPDNDTTYVLTCRGEGGTAKSTASVTLTVPPPPPVVIVPVVPSSAERFCNKPAILMINFDVDKYNIKPQYRNELKTVGDFLKEFPKSYGEISGHTDNTHTRAYNQKLSERRANSVKEYIINNFGIAPERLTSKGYGLEKPIATNKTKAGRAKNRRIEANFVCENESVAQRYEPLTLLSDSKPAATPSPGTISAPAPALPAPALAKGATAAPDAPPLASALRKQPPVPASALPAPVPANEAAAPDVQPLAPALRKQPPVQDSSPHGPAPTIGAAAPDAPPLASALRREQPVPVPELPAPAPPMAAVVPDVPPLTSALRKEAAVPTPAPAPPVPATLNDAAATNVLPLGTALRKQEPEPAGADEEPFILQAENPGTVPADAIMLTGIAIDKNGMSITTSGKIRDFNMITLVEPYSLVINIYGAVNGLGMSKAPVKKFDLLSVRFKSYPDHLQIALDADREEIIPYRAIKTDTGLRVNIKPRSSHHIGP